MRGVYYDKERGKWYSRYRKNNLIHSSPRFESRKEAADWLEHTQGNDSGSRGGEHMSKPTKRTPDPARTSPRTIEDKLNDEGVDELRLAVINALCVNHHGAHLDQIEAVERLITTETTIERLLDKLGTDFKKLTLHSNGRWSADLRYKDKNAERHGNWGSTPIKALLKAVALQKEQHD